MKARAEMLKGELLIQSGPGEGTLIALRIPVTPWKWDCQPGGPRVLL